MEDQTTDRQKITNRRNKLSTEQELALRKRLRGETTYSPVIVKTPKRNLIFASFFQESLWLQQEFEPDSVAYNLPVAFHLKGILNIDALRSAINQIIRRHEILRTTFSFVKGTLTQNISAQQKINLSTIDLSHLPNEIRYKELDNLIKQEAETRFDLAKGPLLQAKLIRLENEENVISLCMHHIVSDGTSRHIFASEMAKYYTDFLQGKVGSDEPLPIQYADFSIWQRNQFEQGRFQPQLDYWMKQLTELPPRLNLPADKVSLLERTAEGSHEKFLLDKKLYFNLKVFCQQKGVTLFMFLLSIFNILLFRYTQQEDIVIGSPITNRKYKELEQLIGFFTNTLVFRARPHGNSSFINFLQQIKKTSLEAYVNQDLPYEKLVSELQPERFADQSSIFQIMFTLQNTHHTNFDLQDLTVSYLYAEDNGAKFDLSIVANDTNETLEFYIEYASDLFFANTIQRMGKHFIQLVQSVLEEPNKELQYLRFLTREEEKQILEEWNSIALRADGPVLTHQSSEFSILQEKDINQILSSDNSDLVSRTPDKCIHELFEEQTKKTPQEIAVVYGNENITYQELNNKANQLALYLKENGIGSETLIGICVERSITMIIGLLGILKAGAAYLPIDPSYPKKRLSYILQDAKVRFLLTNKKFSKEFENIEGLTGHFSYIELDKILLSITGYETTNLQLAINPFQLAYVIYTSGSTGHPKGVMVEHRNVFNFILGMDEKFKTKPGVWLSATSISFDISVLELFWTLARGFKVILIEADTNYSSVSDQNQGSTIDFSLFYFASSEQKASDNYHLLLEGAKFADTHGFTAVWTPERHFTKFGGLYSNPSVTSAALAMITKHIDIRAGSCVLPLHHPIRVAEEWALVDNLSNGRIGVSFASGWQPNDFIFAPDKYEQRQEVMLEDIIKVRSLWRGESLTFTGTNNRKVALKIYPRPIQKELPFWLTSSGNPETFRKAGELGANLLTHLLGQSVNELAEKLQIYRDTFRKHHPKLGDGYVTLMLHTFVSNDENFVLQQVKEPLKNYLLDSIGLLKPFAEAVGKDINSISKDDLDALLEHAFERYYKTSGLFGTPESCSQMISQLKTIGVNEIACLLDFGIPTDIALENLEHLNQLKEKSRIKVTTLLEEIPILIKEHKVTHFQCTPVVANLLVGNENARITLQSLKQLFIGGEDFPLLLAQTLTNLVKGDVFNLYGPTETTVWSSAQKFSKSITSVSIGRPIANTNIYILDSNMQLLPQGIIGEIYIGGAGVTRGYLNQDEMTKEKFINMEFEKGKIERLYKTGDLAKYLSDGTIKYIARNDNQVKVRGFRIELGEIENIALNSQLISDCVAIIHEDLKFGKQIIAYYTCSGEKEVNEDNLRIYLSNSLPYYMTPSQFVKLDKLPFTPNGKVDRKQLSTRALSLNDSSVGYVEPKTLHEKILAHIWAKILKKEKIGINDNFFDLGGNSILAIEMLSLVKNANLQISPRQLFQYPTIAQLANHKDSSFISRTKSIKDLISEVQLDDTIQNNFFAKGKMEKIFITGSTGFLGGFLLRDTLEYFQKSKIYCIVRADDVLQGLDRIRQNLIHYKLWQDHYMERIIPVVGDISKEKLGLENSEFDQLAQDIDIIIHNAAVVNFVQSYEQLKPTNIFGTQEILKLASYKKIKPVHYVSTISVFSNSKNIANNEAKEQDDLIYDAEVEGGYMQTKWVADQIMLTAQKKGFPINIYRPGKISGCSKTGVCNTQDVVSSMLKGCIQLGAVPQTNHSLNLAPVDYVSHSIIHIMKQEENIGKNFHLTYPTLISIKEITNFIQNLGYTIEEIPYSEWYQRLINSLHLENNVLHKILGFFDPSPEYDPWRIQTYNINSDNTTQALKGENIKYTPVGEKLLETYFNYFFDVEYIKPINK